MQSSRKLLKTKYREIYNIIKINEQVLLALKSLVPLC